MKKGTKIFLTILFTILGLGFLALDIVTLVQGPVLLNTIVLGIEELISVDLSHVITPLAIRIVWISIFSLELLSGLVGIIRKHSKTITKVKNVVNVEKTEVNNKTVVVVKVDEPQVKTMAERLKEKLKNGK